MAGLLPATQFVGIDRTIWTVEMLTTQQEKKLAVFWIMAALRAILNTRDFRRMAQLRELDTPESWKTAWIVLDHTPCGNVSTPMVVYAETVLSC
jgi:hypothetical protein